MISIKVNDKGEPVEVYGKRTTSSSIYRPNQKEDFQISRSKFDNFILCPRCFYLDRVCGIKDPGMPGWSLNALTDGLLKVEFDLCRSQKKSHRILIENGLDHIIPFEHPDIDDWRNSLHKGIKTRYKNTNIIMQGGVDDVWIDTKTNDLIVVDYKSQSNDKTISIESYLSDKYHQGYKRQMDFYNYVLQKMGYKTSKYSYFLVVNGEKNEGGFNGNLRFTEYLIPYEHNLSWIESKIDEMIKCLNSDSIPEINKCCENCIYAFERAQAEK